MTEKMKHTLADAEWEKLRELWLSGVITRNEYRVAAGYPKLPSEQGDVYCIPLDDSRLDYLNKLRVLREKYPDVYAQLEKDAKAKESHSK